VIAFMENAVKLQVRCSYVVCQKISVFDRY